MIPRLLLLFLLTASSARAESVPELEALEVRLIHADAQLAAATTRLRELEGRVEGLETRLSAAESALSERRERTALRLRAMYRFRHRGFLPLLFAADSPHDLLQSARYFLRVVRDDERALERWREAVAEARMVETTLGTERDALLKAAGEAHLAREEARGLRDEQRGAMAAAPKVERERYQKRRVERGGAALELKLDLRQEEAPRDIAVQTVEPTSTFPRSLGLLPMPAVGPVERAGRGVVIGAVPGAKIKAVHAGVVLKSLWITQLGRVLIVDHGDSWFTVYGHAERFDVGPGARVAAGQVLGLVGETGSLDGPRLHFEVRHGTSAEDPMQWLNIPAGVRVQR